MCPRNLWGFVHELEILEAEEQREIQQKIEEELQEEELLEDLLRNQQINGLAQGKMSQNSSNETDSKMAKTGKQATSVNNKKQAAAQAGFH